MFAKETKSTLPHILCKFVKNQTPAFITSDPTTVSPVIPVPVLSGQDFGKMIRIQQPAQGDMKGGRFPQQEGTEADAFHGRADGLFAVTVQQDDHLPQQGRDQAGEFLQRQFVPCVQNIAAGHGKVLRQNQSMTSFRRTGNTVTCPITCFFLRLIYAYMLISI